MTATSDTKSLELTVTNFGPIAEGKIELRPMTVFVGPSNTGKSYMASLIYALHRSSSSNSEESRKWHSLPKQFWAHRASKTKSGSHSLSEENIEDLFNWINEATGFSFTTEAKDTELVELPECVAKLVRPLLDDEFFFGEDLDGQVARCFGVDQTKDLRRYNSECDAHINLKGHLSSEAQERVPFSYEYGLTEQGSAMTVSLPKASPLQLDLSEFKTNIGRFWLENEEWPDEVPEKVFAAIQFLIALARAVITGLVGSVSRPAYYLPADRAGVMHSHQVVVRSFIASASRAALRPDSPIPVLSGILGDFLDQLVVLASSSHRTHEDYDDLAQHLELTLLGGTVHDEGAKQIDCPAFSYRPIGWKRDLPLMNASSMVSELAPVVLYLRHVVQPGDLLIIEEPEAHLHPEMQTVFTRQLVAAVQSGIRILITTHSEWILEELANLVRLSELPKERRVGIENEDIALSPDQFGAWFFEPNEEEGGSFVREISLDEESATFPAGFGLVTESLYNRWAEISSRIQEG